ncbi:hypothetical protein [Myceligenerans cantabricum]
MEHDALLNVSKRLAASNEHLRAIARLLGEHLQHTKGEVATARWLQRAEIEDANAERRRATRNEVGMWVGVGLAAVSVAAALLGR